MDLCPSNNFNLLSLHVLLLQKLITEQQMVQKVARELSRVCYHRI